MPYMEAEKNVQICLPWARKFNHAKSERWELWWQKLNFNSYANGTAFEYIVSCEWARETVTNGEWQIYLKSQLYE